MKKIILLVFAIFPMLLFSQDINMGDQTSAVQCSGMFYDSGGPAGYSKRIYKVKRGDTLGQIAETFGTRASKIRRWNNMKYGSHLIHAGQKLVIWVKR